MGFFTALSHFFGARRRFVRRLGSLCLVVLGVHAAGDLIDNGVFAVLDKVDLFFDELVWKVLDTVAGWGLFSVDRAADWSTRFADWVDVEAKQTLGLWLALIVEIGVVLVLLDFVWGRRQASHDVKERGIKGEFMRSVRELGEAFTAFDLERVAIVPVVLCFSLSGALWAGRGLETIFSQLFTDVAPLWRLGVNVAASGGLLAALLLVWRFVPDLVDGAILRAHDRALEQLDTKELDKPPPMKKRLRMALRGAPLAFVVLPLAVVSVFTEGSFLELIGRIGAAL